MEITEEKDVPRVQSSLHHLFDMVVNWVFIRIRLQPLAI